MYPEIEPRRRGFGGAIYTVIALSLMGYLAFAALQGEFGLFRLFQIEAEEHQLRQDLATLRDQRLALSNKTDRLSESPLDLELLDEQARKILGLARTDEIIPR